MTESKTWHIFVDSDDRDPDNVNTFIVNADYVQRDGDMVYLKENPGVVKAAFPLTRVRACMLGTGKYDKSLADKH